MQGQYTYEPFGKTTVTGVVSTNAFKYTGREDDGTGLYYYRARYYHPGLQRFISEDPIGFNGGDVNLYGYVGNDPLNLIDPLGQAPHTKGKRKSTENDYEKGEGRNKRDRGGEKGDAAREAARRAPKLAGCAAELKGCLNGAKACPGPWKIPVAALCLLAYRQCLSEID